MSLPILRFFGLNTRLRHSNHPQSPSRLPPRAGEPWMSAARRWAGSVPFGTFRSHSGAQARKCKPKICQDPTTMLTISAPYHYTRAKRKAALIYQSMESATSTQSTSLVRYTILADGKSYGKENSRNDEKEGKESPVGSGRLWVIM